MKKFVLMLAMSSALVACGGENPFVEDPADDPGETPDDGTTPIEGDRTLPPGTPSPTPTEALFRSEPRSTDAATDGNGFARDIVYDASADTFTVDNLAFDGDNTYQRGVAVSSLGPYAVYEAPAQFTDPTSGKTINQFTHRAIYGVSTSSNTRFAIVRTGAYADYGFGGFIYQRDNGVVLPETGQGHYTGTMAGMRDFTGAGGLEYTTADVDITIDFEDFNPQTGARGDAVRGSISNRVIYDINGNDITDTVLNRIEAENNIVMTQLPTATFTIDPGVMDDNGEILGGIQSTYIDSNGERAVFETGNYYAIVSGTNAEEIVGVVVMESSIDPASTTARETGGFVVYKN